MIGRRLREFALVALAATVVTVAMTYPVAFKIGRVGRVDNGDGQISIWNVAWVARTLVLDPLHVFDANIFYPHRGTLAYSENNLGAGALAIPVYWATRNPYAAHNFVLLLSFIFSGAAMYYLVRHLVCDRGAAVVSAISFAFCPYVFAHTPHIQLLMTAGLPCSLLAFHWMADRPTPGRGALLGLAMAAQAICCGYYGVFVILMVGYASLVVATTRRLWASPAYWLAIGVAAVVSIALVAPAFWPYLRLQRVEGFSRQLDQARQYSSNWSDYLASSAYAHSWMLGHLSPWVEVAFPGLVAGVFGIAGAWLARARQRGELVILYGGLAALAGWASFGPAGGLYSALYRVVPVFSLLRAPARFGLIVDFGFSVLAGLAVSKFAHRFRRPGSVVAVLAVLTLCELAEPTTMRAVEPVAPVYRMLATLPRAPVIELPFYYPEVGLYQHSKYMLASTAHWMPLVNGYSDYIPPDFLEHVMILAPFPSQPALRILEPMHVRYAVFHLYGYNESNRHDILTRLDELAQYFRPLYMDDTTRLYEIIGFPPQ